MKNHSFIISRDFLVLVLFGLLVIIGCQEPEKEPSGFEAKTYAADQLAYPVTVSAIGDSTKSVFIQNFFLPWDIYGAELTAVLDSFPGKDLSFLEDYLADDDWYGENKKPHKRILREEIVDNVDKTTFPNFLRKGIVIAHTNLRRIPSNRPGFAKYSKAGEGFPFDYFQETNLWANTPLQLMHLTRDKQWCFVLSPYYKGWVPMRDLAVVTGEFIAQWQTGSYAMPLSDKVHLQDVNSLYTLNAKIGMVLPVTANENEDGLTVLYANTDENLNAKILKAKLPNDQVAFNDFEFGTTTLQQLVTNLIGRPYGWGGNLENRDCSSMIRDFMATYQIWLPRDSKDQIEIGKQFELKGTLEQKMATIKEKGIPFQSILRKKGHNMLYVGLNENEEPLIFHAIWGLKTSYENAQLAIAVNHYPIEGLHLTGDGALQGRYIIGESVITAVTLGAENKGITLPILDEIYMMTNFLE